MTFLFQSFVEGEAASLYEAAVLALGMFRQPDCQPEPASQLEIRVTSPSVTLTLTVKKVREWLDSVEESERKGERRSD